MQDATPVAASAVRVFDGSGEAVGAGFLIGPRQFATCAHVVTAALGGSPDDPGAPAGRVRVDLPLLGLPYAGEAVVRSWRPMDPVTGTGDVAILELIDAPPGSARVPPLYRPDRLWGHRFRVMGFPVGMQDGVWASGELRDRQGTRWLQLQGDPSGPPIAQGFSGAPVWDEVVEAVVGMTVASDVRPESTTAYLVPIEDVFGVDPRLLPNPYRGLEPFGEEDAAVFYGRDAEVARLEALVDRQPVVAVVGRSGIGKSSLVRAGLLPRLRRRGVRIVEFRPGPTDGSATATLDRFAELVVEEPGRPVLLFADQFEEVVGTGPAGGGPTSAQGVLRRLVDMVGAAPRQAGGAPSLQVVLTLRWEAMNELLTDEVAETFEHGTLSLAPMGRGQLRQAVVGPAAHAPGLGFEPGLVEQILDDAVAEPGQLPLVESLLAELWESRQGGTLRATDYEQHGGVRAAIARHAEEVLRQLGSAGDDSGVRRLFTMLARPDDGAGFVRRAARLDELSSGQQQMVEDLARRRLLVVGRQTDGTHTVELAHQALIDHWPRFRRWLDEDREYLGWQHQVRDRRRAWDQTGHDDGALVRGAALVRAEEWLHRRGDEVPGAERGFVEASRRRARSEVRRRRLLLSALGMVVVSALLLGTLFAYQRRVTAREEAMSDSRELAALSADTATSDPAWSIALALAAYERRATPEAENALFRHYVAFHTTEAVLSGASGEIVQVEASGDGRLVAARTAGGTITLWTREPDQPVETRHLPGGNVVDMAVSEDGTTILLHHLQGVRVYDVATAAIAWEVPVAPEDVRSMALDEDGRVALRLDDADTTDPGTVELWEPTEGAARLVRRLVPRPGDVLDPIVGFGPEADTVVLWNRIEGVDAEPQLVAWNTAAGELATVTDAVSGGAISPDGVVVVCESGLRSRVVRLDLRDGSERSFSLPPEAGCESAAGSPLRVDRRADVLVSALGFAVDLRTGVVVGQPHPPVAALEDAILDGPVVTDGDRHLSLWSDGAAVMLTEVLVDDRPLPAERVQEDDEVPADRVTRPAVRSAQLLPDGEHILSATADSARFVVARSHSPGDLAAAVTRPAARLPTGEDGLVVNRDGTLLADRVTRETIQVRELPGLDLVAEMKTDPVTDRDPTSLSSQVMRWDDFGRLITYDGPLAQWWDPSTGDLVAELNVDEAGLVSEDQVDDFHLASWTGPGLVALGIRGGPGIRIVEVDTGREVDSFPVGDDVVALRLQPDSRYFVLLRQGSLLEIWDRVEPRRVLGPLRSLDTSEAANAVARFLPEDGRLLVGNEGRLHWYEAGAAAPTRRLDLGADLHPTDVSADGSAVLYVDARVSSLVMPVLDIDPTVWRRTLCDVIAERPFSAEERSSLPSGPAAGPAC